MHPSFVIGQNKLLTDAKDITIGTNGAAIALVLGYKSKIPYGVLAFTWMMSPPCMSKR
ncbi:hypothetical protein OIDMADRAFT_20634 [Oidiodendron maius Zn]|uniref:Uncharacterized protein n=1 Tax=Oidiodendron maius (strain Zn) TaxID=913774 RepID=A0A0C3H2F1_OIDMZ|nr:hypothetical protein OIDMADRAFT_20634 [Oidiodendron maius Zn]